MKKIDLKNRVAKATGFEHHVVDVVVNAVFDELKAAFLSGEKMEFRKFGTFSKQVTAPKVGRIIATKQPVSIPARNVIKFKASKEILDEMNK